jgi:ATPase involved in DNA repair
MILKKIALQNFKGIRNLEIMSGGANLNIFGDNATGKTTVFDAFLWLLFNKDSQNRNDFEIKTLDLEGRTLHGLDHSVEAFLEVGGQELRLKKVYFEKWTKKRGAIESTFSGNTTDYFIDEVPVQKKEYDERIRSVLDEAKFRLLTDPKYFNEQLPWQKRREILLDICGDVTDAEVIVSDERLAGLAEILGNRSLDDHKKVIAAKRKEINEELQKLPVRIQEASRDIQDLGHLDEVKIKAEISRIEKEKDGSDARLVAAKNSDGKVELQAEYNKVISELLEIQNQEIETKREIDQKNQEAERDHNSKLNEILRLKGLAQGKTHLVEIEEDNKATYKNELDRLRAEWKQIDEQVFEMPEDKSCPTCGQKVEQDEQELRENFNLDKAKKLEQNQANGKQLSEKLREATTKGEALQKDIQNLNIQIETEEKAVGTFAPKPYPDFSENAKRQELQAKKEHLMRQIADDGAKNNEIIEMLKQEQAQIKERMQEQESLLKLFADKEKAEARVKELETDQKRLAAEYERLEKELYLAETFIRTKVDMLENRINQKFGKARFKLFDEQINGGLSECCETTFEGVTYSNLNTAARINIGLDIIKTLSSHYEFKAPIFIDNRESVVELEKMDTQLINLVVSEGDKTLRTEEA